MNAGHDDSIIRIQCKVQGGSPEGTLAWVAKKAKPTPLLWCGNKRK